MYYDLNWPSKGGKEKEKDRQRLLGRAAALGWDTGAWSSAAIGKANQAQVGYADRSTEQ